MDNSYMQRLNSNTNSLKSFETFISLTAICNIANLYIYLYKSFIRLT